MIAQGPRLEKAKSHRASSRTSCEHLERQMAENDGVEIPRCIIVRVTVLTRWSDERARRRVATPHPRAADGAALD